MSVIRHDFGADKKRAIRRFRKLLSLDALHEANIAANPLPYLERASERIDQLERAIFEAAMAGRDGDGSEPNDAREPESETITIPAAEYGRLRASHAVVAAAFTQLSAPDEGED